MSKLPRNSVQSWTESMSARNRIRAVVEVPCESRLVNWISGQTDVVWSTTNEELQNPVDQGQLRRVETGETTRYQPGYARLFSEEIRVLIEESTRKELRGKLAAIIEEIEEWQATYDAEIQEDFEQLLADEEFSSGELREHRGIVASWREDEENRRFIKRTLELYSDMEAVHKQMTDVIDRIMSQSSSFTI